MPSTASPWDAYLEVMNAGHPGVSYRDIQRLAVDAAVRAMKNTGEGASTRKGDETTARAVGVEVPACDGPSTSSPASPARANENTGEGRAEAALSGNVAGPSTQPVQASPTGVREGVSAVDEGSAASRQAAPFPDPIPAWVPSVEEIQQFIDDGREGDLRALIASRAPAQPSVEEMADRLRVARNAWAGYAPGVVISPSDCWLALDRAAIGGGG